ncbi:hypothetical protein AVEN_129477-1 [Araneus ventricosus]|uniref:CCHC-type domain-containing protein n=1 Tax=Araneus ventricosus TaxID=182803 RepID=A0A4Y2VA19_ARAVE|nr:hypothetical protein AVEN_129477-1 [Araneus ventricosus]
MRSCCHSVCFLLLKDSKLPPRVGRAWRPIRQVVHCWSPVYQFGWYPNRLVSLLGIKRKSHSLGLGAKTLLGIPISITPHKSLNTVRGVISESELFHSFEDEIREGLSTQGVINARRITIKRDNEACITPHVILTFCGSALPKSVTAGYLYCRVHPYIQNPIRCYKCQRFGHSKTVCRGNQVCSRCASVGHSFVGCQSEPKCANCSQPHESSSQQCSKWQHEKEIQKLKATKNISYAEARKLCAPTTAPPFATIVKQSKFVQTMEQFTQTDAKITGLFCTPSLKTSVSTITDDKICNVTRPPKKKKSQPDMETNKTTNSVVCPDQQIGNSSNTLVQTKFAPPSSLQLLLESMVTDDSLHDTDSTSTDDFIDYDPHETFEDVKANHDIQYPYTSPLRGTSSLGVTGFTTPRYPSV